MTAQTTNLRTYSVKDRLVTQLVGKCTCATKSPEVRFHAVDCTYAAAAMAIDVIELKDNALDLQREQIRLLSRPWWEKLGGRALRLVSVKPAGG